MKVHISAEVDDPPEPGPLRELARIVLLAEHVPPDSQVTVSLVDPETMAAHNERALGKGEPTDVLAFPLEDAAPGSPPKKAPGGPPLDLGDVVICPEVVAENAAASGVAYDDELALMVAHGLLHLLGYDHAEEAEAERMEARERLLLAAVGRSRP